ncbi:phenylalanine--tRNA ligase beta subunit [Bacteroidia bacterium]|nr:phenylalanine--tRNA ligase beta subunit [Bacteroidia bacterium]
MKISYNWLRDYLQTDLTIEQLASILTDIGLEVDAVKHIESVRGGLEGVVVGHVLTCGRHPDSDHLSVTTVDVGGSETLQIVCGAPNVAAGQKVLVATVGATLYPAGESEGLKIKRSKIRGVESLGMICAEDELGIGGDHSGIMILDATALPGVPACRALDLEGDTMIEIGLTPNRADAASHYGVARDLAAYMATHDIACRLDLPPVDAFKVDNHDLTVDVEVRSPEGAPRYAGVTITGLKIAPSPKWLQDHLRTIGINPKNNVVDITNFVLHEVGQPLHAFDADKIDGRRIVVQTCPEGTPFLTLDGIERKLSADDLMICSATRPMCLAGVFGGSDSGVSDTTVNVFLESALFNPVSIRKSARRHGLNTDASFRFERGVDPNITIYALKRAALMFRELAGGKVSGEIVDIYPAPVEDFRFDISFERINALAGKQIPEQTVRRILAALQVRIEREAGDTLSVAVPPYRVDVRRQVDLIEDILRLYGYNNIEIPTHLNASVSYAPRPDNVRLKNRASEMLSSLSFNEIMSNSLTSSAYYRDLQSHPLQRCVKILNPLSSELDVMRQTLLFNMLEAVTLNVNHKCSDLQLYEIGNCHTFDPSRTGDDALTPYGETMKLGIAVTGLQRTPSWNVASQPSDFFALRSTVERLLGRFGLEIYDLRCEESSSDLFDQALSLSLGSTPLLEMGVVAGEILRRFDLKQPVYFCEIDFGALSRAASRKTVKVTELGKFPEVRRDLALLVDKGVTFAALRKVAFDTERRLLRSVGLFDVYQGDKLPEGKKSYALSFILEDRERTLTDQAIDKAMSNLIRRLETECGATVRS